MFYFSGRGRRKHFANMQLILIVAVLIAPAYSTSVTYAIKSTYSSSGCEASTITEFSYEIRAGLELGSCVKNSVATATAIAGESTPIDTWTKVTCTADTANGYTYGKYSDSACTVEQDPSSTATTGSCDADGNIPADKWVKVGCASTSADVGVLGYTKYSAAGCADSDLDKIGFWLINYCSLEEVDGVAQSEKWVVEDGKFMLYKWTASSDCSGTGTAQLTTAISEGACQKPTSDPYFYQVGTMTDGASIAGYSAPGDPSFIDGNTATSAAISVFLGGLCIVLNLMFC
jgi:hypothetical protein